MAVDTGYPGRGPIMIPVFPRKVSVAVLASGSSGNCSYIGDQETGVLVDCGISARQIFQRLSEVGLADAPIDAVLVSHEHGDHVQGGRVLADRLRVRAGCSVPFFMTAGTAAGLAAAVRPDGIETVLAGHSFRVGSLEIASLSVPHDTRDPVAWRVRALGWHAGWITDLGRATSLVYDALSMLDIAILEFNHDVDLLLAGTYPWHLKQRIRGNHGHLSNAQASQLLEVAASSSLAHLFLAHLSVENNRPALALAAALGTLRRMGRQGEVEVEVALQEKPTCGLELPARPEG
jgi:phosphoribosyl 1,2-cyclic phosphodiesterase